MLQLKENVDGNNLYGNFKKEVIYVNHKLSLYFAELLTTITSII